MPLRSFALAAALLSTLLLALAGPSAAKSKDKPEAPEPPQWEEFHFSERGFVVSFPGITTKPRAASTPVSGQNPLLQHDYQVSLGDDTVFSVVVLEYPEGRAPNPARPSYYTKVIKAYAKGSKTRVRKKAPRIIDRRPGYEAMAETGRGKLDHLIDIVANGDRIYMLVSAGPRGHAKSKDAKRFRDSFRLLGGSAPPQSTASAD
jgi:hypothetical protein